MKDHFVYFARYNRWANETLYAALAVLSAQAFQAERGVFFGSYCGTLNHILVGDQVWLRRLCGEGPAADRLDAVLYPEFEVLAEGRRREDERLIRVVQGWSEAELAAEVEYSNMAGERFSQPRSLILAHLFNHQTHHRSQAHTLLCQDGFEAPPLDLIYFARI